MNHLGSKRAPVIGQKTSTLRYLALNSEYSVFKELSRFGSTRMNVPNFTYGLENTYLVRFFYIFKKSNWPILAFKYMSLYGSSTDTKR